MFVITVTTAAQEDEFKDIYADLSDQCKRYACDLLDQCRSNEEVIAVLNRRCCRGQQRIDNVSQGKSIYDEEGSGGEGEGEGEGKDQDATTGSSDDDGLYLYIIFYNIRT